MYDDNLLDQFVSFNLMSSCKIQHPADMTLQLYPIPPKNHTVYFKVLYEPKENLISILMQCLVKIGLNLIYMTQYFGRNNHNV